MKLELTRIEEIEKELIELEQEDERKVEEAKAKAKEELKINDYVDFDDWYPYFDKEWTRYYHQKKEELEIEKIVVKATNVKVGDGISMSPYTDWYPYTVIERRETPKGFVLTLQEDKAVRTDGNGMSDCQDYRYERDENGRIETIKWNNKKQWFTGRYSRISLGRRAYYDFSF